MSLETKIKKAQEELAAKNEKAQDIKRENDGKFRKKTWREKFGFFPIMWIFIWGVGAGWGYTYIYHHASDLFESKTVVIKVAEAAKIEEVKEEEVEKTIGIFSAYNAEAAQTDADPFIMASGKKVYKGAIANNCLPFGTKVKVNGKIKVVEDRMNSRYDCNHFDIFMDSYDEAIQFGRQEIEYSII